MIISSREAVFLYWAAEGKSSRDIAKIEGTTPEEIEVLVASVVTHLHAKTLEDAIEKARSISLI